MLRHVFLGRPVAFLVQLQLAVNVDISYVLNPLLCPRAAAAHSTPPRSMRVTTRER